MDNVTNTEALMKATLADQAEAKRMIDSLPNIDDFYSTKEVEASREQYSLLSSAESDEEHTAYTIAEADIVEKFFPEGEYNFQPRPEHIHIMCDNSTDPYKILAKNMNTGETFYEGEGYEGLVELHKTQQPYTLTGEYYYTLDKNIMTHLVPAFFGPGVPPREGEPNIIRTIDTNLAATTAFTHISSFVSWARLYINWVDDPSDFHNSYHFVNSHPSMWLNDETEDWINTERSNWLWHSVTKDDNGKVVHMFETGTAVKPERQSHYHTFGFDVYSKTYEEGIVELAWLINKHQKWDGTERTDVFTEATELEVFLAERVKQIEADTTDGTYLM